MADCHLYPSTTSLSNSNAKVNHSGIIYAQLLSNAALFSMCYNSPISPEKWVSLTVFTGHRQFDTRKTTNPQFSRKTRAAAGIGRQDGLRIAVAQEFGN